MAIATFEFIGCVKNSQPNQPITLVSKGEAIQDRVPIYRACWEKWGRASKKCDGWGLCYFEDCWFWQDDCCGIVIPHPSGVIEYDGSLGAYVMTITLTTIDSLQLEASASELPLIVDEDIIEDSVDENWDTFTIEEGEYPFISEIGAYGGYRIPVILE